MDPLTSLKAAADARLPDGRRLLVPVFGSGVNRQACPGSVEDPSNSWDALLRAIREDLRDLGFDVPRDLPLSAIASWETLLRAATGQGEFSRAAHEAEAALRSIVQRRLTDFERVAGDRVAYRELLEPGFADVLSLNFDRSLARAHGAGPRMSCSPWGSTSPRWTRRGGGGWRPDPSLFRHDLLPTSPQPTRVWYPHGDTARQESTKLGARAYGCYLRDLDGAFSQLQRRRRRWLSRGGAPDDWDAHLRGLPARELDWVSVFLTAPLVFVGTRLRGDEWTLWWLLQQRARLFARTPPELRPGVWLLLCDDSLPEDLAREPAGLQVLRFDRPPDLWRTWAEVLAPP